MPYNVNKKTRLKDIISHATRVKNTTDDLEERVTAIEEFIESVFDFLNSVIENIEERGD